MLRPAAILVRAMLVVIAMALTAPGAFAADQASISHVEVTTAGLQLLVSVPADARVDLDAVGVTIGGDDATTTAVPANSTTTVRRSAVLAIDTSNSMRGERFASAKAAAMTFLETVPDDVYVGIVAFAGKVSRPLDPTLDRDRARDVVRALELGPQTRLYDGVLAAVEQAGAEGQRTLLVLSDGADTSDTPLSDVTEAVATAEVLVNVVALEQSGAAEAALRKLAGAGNGQVIDADADALRVAFTRQADVLARQVLVTAQVPESVTADEASISVSLPSGATTLTADAFAPVRQGTEEPPPAGAAAAVAGRGLIIPETWMYAGLVAAGLGLLTLLVLMVPRTVKPATAAERAATYTDLLSDRTATSGTRIESEQALTQVKDAAHKVLQRNKTLEAKIAARLEGAGSALKPSEWLLLHTAIFLGVGLVGLLLGTGSLFVGVLFLLLGAVGPWFWLGIRRRRRSKAFNASLPDTLQLMSGSLTAGLSLAQSVDTIVREGAEPIASEFKRVMIETRLGVPLEDALEGVADRFGSKDFGWAVMAIKIQRQVGGNLAELLNQVAATMREREYMRRQVAALAAEGKLSAWVLGGLPPVFLLYLVLTNRTYVMPLFTEPMGWAMLLGLATLLGVGVFWMSRLIKVEV